MEDGNERDGMEGKEMPEHTSQPAGDETAGPAQTESGTEAVTDESASSGAIMPPGGESLEAGRRQGGGFRRWLAEHRMLAGFGIGVLAVILIATAFTAGYFVGRPGTEQERSVPARQFQTQGPESPDSGLSPSPDGGEAGRGWLDVLSRYRDEIESEIAAKLGISVDELQDEMQDGKTVAEIADEKGVSSEELAASVAAEISEIADELAADGEITAAQAENIKSDAEDIAAMYIERGRMRAGMPPGQ